MRELPPDAWPKATRADWRAQVQTDLDGAEPESLRCELDDGVAIEALFEPPAGLGNASPRAARLSPPVACRIAAPVELGDGSPTDAIGARLMSGFDAVRLTGKLLGRRLADGETGWLRSLQAEQVVLTVGPCAGGLDALARIERDGLPHFVIADLAAAIDGLPPSIELAYTFSALAELARGCNQPHPPRAEAVLRRVCVPVTIGTDLLTELAKLRAARWLWQTMVAALTPNTPIPVRLWGHASSVTLPAVDPHTNLVRTALQAFTALAGGCAWFEPRPFDATVVDEAQRLALNQVRLLRHESSVEQVSDPAAGSYAIEALTRDIAERAWAKFQAVEAAGGMLATRHELGAILGVDAARAARAQRLRSGEEVVVGVNRFADPDAAVSAAVTPELETPLAEFAALRRRSAAAGPRRALLLPFGEPSARRTGAEFAAEFLRLAGLDPIDAPGFRDVAAMTAAVATQRPALAVLCGDATAHPELVREAMAAIRQTAPATLLYATGLAPAGSQHWGAIGFLHAGLDRLSTLAGILDRLDAHP